MLSSNRLNDLAFWVGGVQNYITVLIVINAPSNLMNRSRLRNPSVFQLRRNFCGRCVAYSLILSGLSTPHIQAMPNGFQMPKVNEPSFRETVVNLADVGGSGDGSTFNTEIIANAIASLAKKGGGKLVIPPGIWLTGPVRLQSNVELHLDAGALLQFASDYKQFPLVVLNIKGEKDVQSVSPLFGENLENVAITGHGVIDGAGEAWRPVKRSKLTEAEWKALTGSGFVDQSGSTWWPSREASEGGRLLRRLRGSGSFDPKDYEPAHLFLRPRLLKLINCRKVLLEGVTFQNSPSWTLNPMLCEDLTIRNVTARNPWYGQNTDALDVESCRNVVIRDSTFDVGDDGICLKIGPGRSRTSHRRADGECVD